MNRMLTVSLLLMLAGCGGSDEAAEPANPPAKANNPLAEEQALMQQAAGLQEMLDQDAARKKEQLPE